MAKEVLRSFLGRSAVLGQLPDPIGSILDLYPLVPGWQFLPNPLPGPIRNLLGMAAGLPLIGEAARA